MRTPISQELRDFALRVLASEALASDASEAQPPTAFRVCDRLRQPLSALAGLTGFKSLLSRAKSLATFEAPWLVEVELQPDGSLQLITGFEPPEDSAALEGGVVLVAQLLGLLITFIGEPLTQSLVHDLWTDLAFDSETHSETHEPTE